MRPERLPSWEDVIPLIQVVSDLSIPLEMCVLKCHLMVEVEMYRLLALRLDIDEQHLPPLQYFQLSKLSLAGPSLKDTLVKVLALNDLRNELSHELSGERLQPAYAAFARKGNLFWPDTDVFNRPKEFGELREISVRWAAYSCVTDVLCALSDLAVSRPDFPAGDIESARQTISHIKETVEKTRRNHNSLRVRYEQHDDARR